MKRIVLLAAAFLALASLATAGTVTIMWDANPPAELVTGYEVSYGTTSRTAAGFTAYTTKRDVGNVTQSTIDVGTTYPVYMAVVAYNAQGLRSDYSIELVVPSANVRLLSVPGTANRGTCANLPATRPNGTPAQVQVCTDATGKTTMTVLP